MVVEDDEHYRGLLEFQLADEGYEVVAFDNGRDALDALPNVVPDVVLLDLIMPGLDGLTVLQRIRADDPRGLARDFLARADVRSLKFEDGAVIIETGKPDMFYARLTELAASGEYGAIDEVTSPDDNLQAVFKYLVK